MSFFFFFVKMGYKMRFFFGKNRPALIFQVALWWAKFEHTRDMLIDFFKKILRANNTSFTR